MMNKCESKTPMYIILVLQLITTFERQVFDFLGYMWLPILWNFFNILLVILGIFGVYQSRPNYIISYLFWSLLYLTWNIFLICFFAEAGSLEKERDLLSFGTGSLSWWMINGYGCRPVYKFSPEDEALESSIPSHHPIRPSNVTGCAVEYQNVEIAHAAVQSTLGLGGLILGAFTLHYCLYILSRRKEKSGSKAMYSIEYSPQVTSGGSNQDTDAYDNDLRLTQMTPRRVKRRSHTRASTRSASAGKSSLNRNHRNTRSTRSIGPNFSKGNHQRVINPVNKYMEQAEKRQAGRVDSSTSNDDVAARYGQINPGFETSRPGSLYGTTITTSNNPAGAQEATRPPSALTNYSNFHGQRKPMLAGHHNILTQESLNQQEAFINNQSFDDLPPPPPPLSSSPTREEISSACQMPVPQERQKHPLPKRSDYVNMPIPENFVPQRDELYYTQDSSSAISASPLPPPSDISSYGDTQTLRADTKLLPPPKNLNYTNGYSVAEHNLPEPRSNLPSRVPNGHARRDRTSLRAKHRKDMQAKSQQSVAQKHPESDEYGFSPSAENYEHFGAIPKRPLNEPYQNGQDEVDDKWYLHDSMKPVGAPRHGPNCKCYRCQRKSTHI